MSLCTRETHVKTTVKTLPQSGQLESTTQETAGVGEDGERGASCTAAGTQTAQPLWRAVRVLLRKLRIERTLDPVTEILGICLKETLVQKTTCPHVPCSITHGRRDVGTTRVRGCMTDGGGVCAQRSVTRLQKMRKSSRPGQPHGPAGHGAGEKVRLGKTDAVRDPEPNSGGRQVAARDHAQPGERAGSAALVHKGDVGRQ